MTQDLPDFDDDGPGPDFARQGGGDGDDEEDGGRARWLLWLGGAMAVSFAVAGLLLITPVGRRLVGIDAPTEASLPADGLWLRIERGLEALGLDPGPVDGVRDAKTEAAAKLFLEQAGLSADLPADALAEEIDGTLAYMKK